MLRKVMRQQVAKVINQEDNFKAIIIENKFITIDVFITDALFHVRVQKIQNFPVKNVPNTFVLEKTDFQTKRIVYKMFTAEIN